MVHFLHYSVSTGDQHSTAAQPTPESNEQAASAAASQLQIITPSRAKNTTSDQDDECR